MIAQFAATLAELKKRYGPAPAVEALRESHAGKRPIHANGAPPRLVSRTARTDRSLPGTEEAPENGSGLDERAAAAHR